MYRRVGNMAGFSRGRYNLLVEDGNAAELSACPFCLVFLEFGVYGFEKWSHKRYLP